LRRVEGLKKLNASRPKLWNGGRGGGCLCRDLWGGNVVLGKEKPGRKRIVSTSNNLKKRREEGVTDTGGQATIKL